MTSLKSSFGPVQAWRFTIKSLHSPRVGLRKAEMICEASPKWKHQAWYLIRFDDICPAMNWRVWTMIEAILIERGIKPILAVVPENRDPGLVLGPPAADFWQRVRRWRDWGWTIAMHGYQHLYVTADPGVLRVSRRSEFAGLPRKDQAEKLALAAETFRAQGIEPRVWVAPGHSFDHTTLSLLPALGIDIISDGFSLYPFLDAAGLLWIPVQMAQLRPVPPGIWTVCCHHNCWDPTAVQRFAHQIDRHQRQITDVDSVAAAFRLRRHSLLDWAFHQVMSMRSAIRSSLSGMQQKAAIYERS